MASEAPVAADSSVSAESKDTAPAADVEPSAEGSTEPAPLDEPSADDNMVKLREAARQRRLRRNQGRPAPEPQEKPSQNPVPTVEADAAELERLRAALSTAKLEMASMRRNHVANAQKLTAERDMFALQLSKEQESAGPESKRAIEELRSDLSASKLRVQNLEEDNANMRAELKELRLRVTAFKTMDAANSGYESIVNDLIAVKLQCATLSEEKENLSYENRVLKSDNDNLSTANGLLEKSRAEWVSKYGELEKKLRGVDGVMAPLDSTARTADPRSDKSMSMGSDLQELAL